MTSSFRSVSGARRTDFGQPAVVFVHTERPADLQFRWVQRCTRRLRVGLELLRVHRLLGMAPTGARRATGPAHTCETRGSGCGHAAARKHAAVRRVDCAGDGDRRDRRGSTDRRDHRLRRGGRANTPRRLRHGGRVTRTCFRDRPSRHSSRASEHQLRTAPRRRPAGHSRGVGCAGAQPVGLDRDRRAAVGCAQGEGLHVCEDEVVLERVDETGAPVGPDQPAARTLATGLANRTFPFIRYDLGDQVDWPPGQCACGSVFARVADIGGRRDDDFRSATATRVWITTAVSVVMISGLTIGLTRRSDASPNWTASIRTLAGKVLIT